jgi:hypothetical protein
VRRPNRCLWQDWAAVTKDRRRPVAGAHRSPLIAVQPCNRPCAGGKHISRAFCPATRPVIGKPLVAGGIANRIRCAAPPQAVCIRIEYPTYAQCLTQEEFCVVSQTLYMRISSSGRKMMRLAVLSPRRLVARTASSLTRPLIARGRCSRTCRSSENAQNNASRWTWRCPHHRLPPAVVICEN